MRIVNAGKSKYYEAALGHLEKARDLYCGADQAAEWEAVLETLRTVHSRKRGFLSTLEQALSGESKRSPSFAQEGCAFPEKHTFERLTG